MTLVLAAPVLLGSLVLAMRGSQRARAVWIGMLVYSVYNATFSAFGTTFNDVFVLHIAMPSTSRWRVRS